MAAPKVNPKLLNEISSSDHNLKHTETQEKNVLPSTEAIAQEKTIEGIGSFDKSQLKHAHTEEKTAWKEAINHDNVVGSVGQFDKGVLRHQEVSEKNPLPGADVIQQEKKEQELLSSISNADRNSLNKVETQERTALSEIVAQEQTKKGIETFSKDSLKHAETTEKCLLPSKEDIQAEKKSK